ncbi:hypothetical protein [Alicyclobacillus sp.]|uniref:hypothetical protein n=1 Tax=Alicyclobacillus sp. TaxID=61169 RepID=UPI0025C5380A|nr:hypothetical protein [Alicyclobacillus sp.]MCL6515722.1 hypothetical protein [Alicyclobacillus sp.]
MGKQRRGRAVARDRDDDKPAFAADIVPEPAKPREKRADGLTGITAADRFGRDTAEKLAKLKAAIQAETERAAKEAQSGRSPRRADGPVRPRSGTAGRTGTRPEEADAEREASFAELFDPQPGDDESFADLLERSQLDWRKFKDE